MANPDDHDVILDVTISKEPLGPVTRHGDNQWHDIVTWVVFATFFAEEYGITQANVGSFESGNPEVNRFLGKEGGLGAMLGLDDDWAVRVIQAVGNYAEIFERNLSPLGPPGTQPPVDRRRPPLRVPLPLRLPLITSRRPRHAT